MKGEEEALQSFKRCIDLDPIDLDAYDSIGRFYSFTQSEKALAIYEQGLRLYPECASFHWHCALMLARLERHREALDACNQAIHFDPAMTVAYDTKGDSLLALGRFQEALAAYDQALQLHPHYTSAYCGKAKVLSRLRRYDDALSSYDQAIYVRPDDLRSYKRKAELLAELGRYEDAVATYDQFIE
jgi:tetratricopeptide (TPR) repeat protein